MSRLSRARLNRVLCRVPTANPRSSHPALGARNMPRRLTVSSFVVLAIAVAVQVQGQPPPPASDPTVPPAAHVQGQAPAATPAKSAPGRRSTRRPPPGIEVSDSVRKELTEKLAPLAQAID